ncbi:MAG: hypothetical protein IPJ81_01610 [Chitinophagaceae bacterium]|nr:hypothetical protein [Chitinophagaceae bacterium]
MIHKLLILFTCFACPVSLFAQYYYKDIVTSKQVAADLSILKEQKIRTVKIKSSENDGLPSEGFFGERKISKDYSRIETMTRSYVTGPSLFTAHFKKELLYKTIDSSQIAVSTSTYEYNDKNNVSKITSIIKSNDDDFTNEIREEHIYSYDGNGALEKMQKVKNGKDTVVILFSPDEKNNIAIEKDTKTGSKYFYYYDAKNRLTDVVHTNDFKTKPLPDYMFEYNGAGLLSQMTNTEEGGNYYYIWKYMYDNGLRVREKCYSKEKRLMGTIEYEYK